MIRRICLVLLLSAIWVGCDKVTYGQSNADKGSIFLTPQEKPYIFGRPISIQVHYKNIDAQPWKIWKPDNSTAVSVHYTLATKKNPIGGFGLGSPIIAKTTTADGKTRIANLGTLREALTIQAGKEHVIDVELYDSPWTGHLAPGKWAVWLSDGNLERESNRAAFEIVFTSESVPSLQRVVADNREIPHKRRQCGIWLKKLKPDLNLKFPREEDLPDAREHTEKELVIELKSFDEFWKNLGGSPAVQMMIDKINQDAMAELELEFRSVK